MAPWDAIGNIGESIGSWGSNIDVPSTFGFGGGGGVNTTVDNGWYGYNGGAGQPATSNPDYLAGAKTWGQNYGVLTGTINAQPAMIQNQMERQGASIGIMGALANQAQETGYLNQDYDIGQRKLGLQREGLGVDVEANKRQPGLLTGLHDLALQGMTAEADQRRRALESQATARGAFTSIGAQQGRFDIASGLMRGVQGENLQYGEKMAQTADQAKKLDIAGRELGISGEQLQNDLERGLARLNLGTATSVADLTNKINSSNLQDAAMARKIWNDALMASDYYARFYPGQNAASPDVQAIGGTTSTAGTGTTFGGGAGRVT
jgi:hypothetical protein